MRLIATMLFTIWCLAVDAQATHPWEHYWQQELTAEDMDAEWAEEAYETLCQMEQEPIDINTATREQLQRLPFLDERQIEDLQAYIYFYGRMQTLGELAMVASIDYNTRCLLSHFVYCGEAPSPTLSASKVLKYGHHQATLTGNVPFYERRGDDNGYLGYPYRHSLRYRFAYSDQVSVGFIGAQDAGEPFFAGKNRWGYDLYSVYAEAHRIGRVKSLTLGRYKASFGMGLVANNDFAPGKAAILASLGNRTYGLRANSSRAAANYLQGAAATITAAKGLDVSAFVSYKHIDATLTADSGIATVVTTGYHRTETEMKKKNNSAETTAGTNVDFCYGQLHVGATVVHTHYDRDLSPDTAVAYRRYYPMGNGFWNAGIHYGYRNHLVNVSGETATGGCGDVAALHTVTLTPTGNVSLMALHRYYGKKYNATHARSFSEGGRVQNEHGAYLGAKWQATRRLTLVAYTDYAYFGAAKYQATHSSRAFDNMLQALYNNKRWALSLRYRLKMRQYDNSAHTALIDKVSHRARGSVAFNVAKWTLTTQADAAITQFERQSTGWMLSQQATYQAKHFKAGATVGYFDTDDSDSQVYAYQPGPLYNFSYSSFSGKGCRYSIYGRADLGKHLMLIATLTCVDYLDRSHISTGLQRIDHSAKTDLQLQARWRF